MDLTKRIIEWRNNSLRHQQATRHPKRRMSDRGPSQERDRLENEAADKDIMMTQDDASQAPSLTPLHLEALSLALHNDAPKQRNESYSLPSAPSYSSFTDSSPRLPTGSHTFTNPTPVSYSPHIRPIPIIEEKLDAMSIQTSGSGGEYASSTIAPGSTTQHDEPLTNDRRKKRLLRNRIAAKECRQRKKACKSPFLMNWIGLISRSGWSRVTNQGIGRCE